MTVHALDNGSYGSYVDGGQIKFTLPQWQQKSQKKETFLSLFFRGMGVCFYF